MPPCRGGEDCCSCNLAGSSGFLSSSTSRRKRARECNAFTVGSDSDAGRLLTHTLAPVAGAGRAGDGLQMGRQRPSSLPPPPHTCAIILADLPPRKCLSPQRRDATRRRSSGREGDARSLSATSTQCRSVTVLPTAQATYYYFAVLRMNRTDGSSAKLCMVQELSILMKKKTVPYGRTPGLRLCIVDTAVMGVFTTLHMALLAIIFYFIF